MNISIRIFDSGAYTHRLQVNRPNEIESTSTSHAAVIGAARLRACLNSLLCTLSAGRCDVSAGCGRAERVAAPAAG